MNIINMRNRIATAMLCLVFIWLMDFCLLWRQHNNNPYMAEDKPEEEEMIKIAPYYYYYCCCY